jgi:hypothetical protein
MLPDEPHEMKQFDGLAAELSVAGRAAREADGDLAPRTEFSWRLRDQLKAELHAFPVAGRPADLSRSSVGMRGTSRWWSFAPMATGSRSVAVRWAAVGIAACVAITTFVYGGAELWPARTTASAADAASAVLVRGAVSIALVSGAQLRQGDEIRVSAGGRATLSLGDGYVRMAGGADIALTSLDPSHIAVDQTTGRIYYRVFVPAGGDYTVTTSGVAWKATGTAFDLDRRHSAEGIPEVAGMALYHALTLHGSTIAAAIPEGAMAVVSLVPDGAPVGSAVISQIAAAALTDEWLVRNAGLDATLGLPLGRLAGPVSTGSTRPTATAGAASPAPTITPAAVATDATAMPSPSSQSGPPTPISRPTAAATAAPTATPTPAPTATQSLAPSVDLGTMVIIENLDYSLTFTWIAYTARPFSSYELVFEPTSSGRTPSFVGGSHIWAAPGPFATTATVSWPGAGDYQVRLEAIGYPGGVSHAYAATATAHVHLSARPSPSPSI